MFALAQDSVRLELICVKCLLVGKDQEVLIAQVRINFRLRFTVESIVTALDSYKKHLSFYRIIVTVNDKLWLIDTFVFLAP